jgi:hypothetical protein
LNHHAIRGDVSAHNHAVGLPIHEVVRELVDLVGLTTVAALAGVKETRAVQQWMEGREPQKEHLLRFALQLTTMVAAANEQDTAQAWLHAANPALNGQTPLVLFRTRPLGETQATLLEAARTFAIREAE